jgi:hypothetical protein
MIGGQLAGIAPAVSSARSPGARARDAEREQDGADPGGPPSREVQARALAKALVLVSDKHPAWTRHDLVKQLALVLPPQTRHMDAVAAEQLLLGLAEEALSGRAGDMVCLEAPQWPPLPRALRRELDGRSVYTRPGVARYATAAQLSLEDTLVARAQTQQAPRLPRELAAHRIGVGVTLLEAQLRDCADDARSRVTQRGLRLDQAAAMMDDRTQRLGQHAARHPAPWALSALGPVPAGPAARRDWQAKASAITAYRELYGHDHPDDPIGPEPSRDAPEQRAAWHEAFLALGPAGGPDVRAMPEGRLWLIRDSYAAETAWAPRHVGKELRLARLGAAHAGQGAIRAGAEADAARKAGNDDRAGRHETLPASYRAMRDRYQQQEDIFARTMADRLEWEHATRHSRDLAITADAELRRRHPDQHIQALRSAEPAPVSEADRAELALAPDQKISEMAGWIGDLAVQRQAFREKLEDRQGLTVPSEDPDWADLGEAFPAWGVPRRDAILQPPKPQITPSEKILELAAERDTEPEAAD